ncbi:hypothetical protein DFJ74DRAFT_39975 [Hyaloraphidium curvatum]|nr:hypothetical protein DFJ74DRAFT_39975 [Hyaloraphidium curvatum]
MSISAPRAAEAEARGSEGPASPSKFEELLSEIDKLTLESEAVARELPVREENRLKVVVEEVKVGQDARDGQVEGDERDRCVSSTTSHAQIHSDLPCRRLSSMCVRSGNQILDELLQDGAASTENAENAESTESTARPVTPSGPAVPSSRLPLRIPTSTGKSPVPPAADAETGFPGLWYRLPNRAAASTHSPTEHTPRSLRLPARVPVREGSPTEKTPLSGQTSSSAGTLAAGRSPEAERHFTPPSYPRPDYSKIPSHYAHTRPGGKPVTGTPADRLRDAAASAAGSAERPLYYVRSTLPSNQNRVNDLFASVLRSESPAGRS